MKEKTRFYNTINILLFLFLLGFVVLSIQSHSHNEAEHFQVERFYHEDDNSIQALVLGSSHPFRGISPMEIYENEGISCYALTTSAQSTMTAYYAIKEALKSQRPELIIIDADSLFQPVSRESAHKYIMDGMSLGTAKIEYAYRFSEYILSQDDTHPSPIETISSDSFIGSLFPVVRYHTEVSNVKESNFISTPLNMRMYSKGFLIDSDVVKAETTVDEMNQLYDSEYNNLDVGIPEVNLSYALKIKNLCENKGINLLFIKVPSYGKPDGQKTYWIDNKYTTTRQFCNKYSISYVDFLYEKNIGLDPDEDFLDGGLHLNVRGAIKMSTALGQYLTDNYKFSDVNLSPTWNADEGLYAQMKSMALLASETDYLEYLAMLDKMDYFDVQHNSIGDDIYYLIIEPISGCIIDNVHFSYISGQYICIRDGIDHEGNNRGSTSDNLHDYENYLIDHFYN